MIREHMYKIPPNAQRIEYIGAVRKGNCTIASKEFDGDIKILELSNCDCIHHFALIDRLESNKVITGSIRKIWDIHDDDFIFEKCWHCYDKTKDPIYCDTKIGEYMKEMTDYEISYISLSEFHSRYKIHHNLFSSDEVYELYENNELRNFDVTATHTFPKFNCKLVKVYKPQLKKGEFTQKVIIGDDNTKKTIPCLFGENLADYDKWENGQRVELYGEYSFYHSPQLTVKDCRIVSEPSTKLNRPSSIRNSSNYHKWVDKVKSVGKCYICGRENKLEAHHINSVADYPNMALDDNNGVCLCKSCHSTYHEDFTKKGDIKSFVEFVLKYKRDNYGRI